MNDKFIVFVYGTLLKGFRNSHFLKESHCLCEDTTSVDQAELILFYDRPFINFNSPKYAIRGALYKVTAQVLAHLDELEGHPVWYKRVEKEFFSKTLNKSLNAFCYEINQAPEVIFSKPYHIGCYRDFMANYVGEKATDFEVKNGQLISIK